MSEKPTYEELETKLHDLERSILLAGQDLMFRLSRDGTHLDYFAPSLDRSFVDPKKFLGRTVNEVLPPHVADRYLNHIHKSIEQGEIQQFEYELSFPGQDNQYYEARLTPIENDEVYAIVREITERKQRRRAEEALRESESKFRRLFELSIDAIFIHQEGRLIDVNNKACEMLGYSRDQLLQMSIGDWVPEHLKEASRKRVDVAKRGGSINFESQWIRADGSTIDVDVSSSIVDREKRIIQGIARDITDRKNAERALMESERRFRELSEMLPEAVFETDTNMNLTYVNQQAFFLFRYTKEDFEKGLKALEMIVPEDRKRAEENVAKRFQGIESSANEYHGLRKDGTTFPILLHASPIIQQKAFCGLRGIIIDITQRKGLEAKLQQAQKMESIGNLAGGIAHDFNNILSSIIGFAELALDDVEKKSPLEDSLLEIYAAGKRARDLVKQILAFARQSEEKRKPIRVDVIAKEVLKLIRSTIPTTIEINQKIESQSLIMGNATQVNQLFMNLCTNAAHAMEDSGGALGVSLKDVTVDPTVMKTEVGFKPGKYIEIKISDTGVGIPENVINHIFLPYFTTKPPGEGTGMGLAVVQGIIEIYGGKITVESKVGKGSTFAIYIPVTRMRNYNQPYKDERLPSGKERILLVEDELPIAKMESQILKRLGYHVTVRTSSVEAFELFRSRPDDFDLAITDMTMPNMTGDQLAAELMQIKPNLPVILCTGYSKKISDEKASAIGIKAFTYKPIVRAELAKIIRKVLDEAKAST